MQKQQTDFTAVLPTPVTLQNSHGEVFLTLSQKEDFLVAKWHGHITSEDVVTAASAYYELIKHTPCPKLLNDKSEISGEWAEANDWLEFEWMPQVLEAGLQRMAHVYSQNMLSCSSEFDLYLRAAPQLNIANFTGVADAEAWLAAC